MLDSLNLNLNFKEQLMVMGLFSVSFGGFLSAAYFVYTVASLLGGY